MHCPKCKHEIANNLLRCSFCGVKIKMVCPACQAINKFGSERCATCGVDLIKYCPSCNAANLPKMKSCRKCGYALNPDKTETIVYSLEKENVIKTAVPEISQDETFAVMPEEKEIEPDNSLKFVISQLDEKFESTDYKASTDSKEEIISESVNQAEIIEPSELFESLESVDITEAIDIEKVIEQPDIKAIVEEVKDLNNAQETETSLFAPDIEEMASFTESKKAEKEKQKDNSQNLEIKYYSQIQAKQKIVNIIKNPTEKHIISVNGEEGIGKSIVIDYVRQELQQENIISLIGECSPLTQISSFGLFQDVFLRLLSLPAFCANVESFTKHNRKIFENVFHLLSQEEINDFVNLLYPNKKSKFEEIIENKDRTFTILEKVLNSIAEKNKYIIVIDNFDLIDGISYEFLLYLIDKKYFNENIKLLITYKERRVAQSYFCTNNLDENIYENIYLDKLSEEEVNNFIDNFVANYHEILPQDLKKTIFKNSFGNATYVEQVMAYFRDIGYLYLKNNKYVFDSNKIPMQVPSSISEVIQTRLESSSALSPVLKNILFTASIMGYKFDASLLANALMIPDEQFLEALEKLKDLSYIIQINQYSYEFKSLSLWRYIYEEAKKDEFYKENNEKLYKGISQFVLSNNPLIAVIEKNLLNSEKAIEIWIENAELASYTGDINLYIISMKQCLKIIGDSDAEHPEVLYNDICEKIGKLSYKSNPTEAIGYLTTVISASKKTGNVTKIVELCSYLVNSCYNIGNYHGVIEAVNLVINSVEDNFDALNLALIKSRKLKALFYIGNCEEVINAALNEIISVLEDSLSKPFKDPTFMTMVYESWLESNLIMANAYAAQGNEKCFEIISNVLEVMKVNKLESKYYQSKADISKAFAYTVVGKIKKSFEILDLVANNHKDDLLNSELLSQWNLIYVINKVLTNQAANLKEELFSLATFANNTNDQFSKNIIKTILGYIIQKDGNYAKALEIYNDQITYFAKEKIAIGALLGWYLIAQVTLTIEGADRSLDIASKALEVAQNPKINNYNFIVYLQKLIAEIYMIKGDLDSTKMYLEKSLLIANQFGLKYAQVEIYKSFAKYIEEVISIKAQKDEKEENAQAAIKMYNKALAIANEIEVEGLIISINKAKASFRTYCQLNGIQL